MSKLNDFWNSSYQGLRVYSMALHQCGEDLLQDIYLRLHDHEDFTRIVEDDENPTGYVMRCLRGEVDSVTSRFYYKYRKDRTSPAFEHLAFMRDQDYDHDKEALLCVLDNAKHDLTVSERAVLTLHYRDKLNMKQISTQAQVPYDEVRGFLRGAEEKLKTWLTDQK